MALIDALKPLAAPQLRQVLGELRTALGGVGARSGGGRPMTAPELRALAQDGLIAVGAHAVSHAPLPGLSPARQRQEVAESKATCEAILGRPVAHFAYPFGEVAAVTRRVVRDCGFAAACTVERGTVGLRSDPFLLPRLHVGDWTGEDFERRLASATSGVA
jgi:peptidoglycan/xylan/chitin deacetylase (PgdA/CDA1 family)